MTKHDIIKLKFFKNGKIKRKSYHIYTNYKCKKYKKCLYFVDNRPLIEILKNMQLLGNARNKIYPI